MRWPIAACIAGVALLAGCAATGPADPFPAATRSAAVQRDVERLGSFFVGTWESIPQPAGAGESTPMKLRHARIWPERTDGIWFYAEYERIAEPGHPYRQRLYRLGDAGNPWMVTYALPGDPARFAGEWKRARPFEGSDPAGLAERPGCRISWATQGTVFAGGTLGTACRDKTGDAGYETTEFYLTSATLRTWDRGFDATGKQVSGSQAGPLELRRMSQVPR